MGSVCIAVKGDRFSQTIGGDLAGLVNDDRLARRVAQTGWLEIRPRLFRTATPDGLDVETVSLGEGRRDRRLYPRRKTREEGDGGGDESSNRERGKSLDHDGPLSLGLEARLFALPVRPE